MATRKIYGTEIHQGSIIHATAGNPAATGAAFGPPTDFGVVIPRVAHIKFDFAVDGGVIGEIIPAKTVTLPANAIVIGGIMNVITAPVGVGATISIGTHAGSGAASILAATAITAMTLDIVTELLGTNSQAATQKAPFKMTAAGAVSITLAVHALTAGVIELFLTYIVAAAA